MQKAGTVKLTFVPDKNNTSIVNPFSEVAFKATDAKDAGYVRIWNNYGKDKDSLLYVDTSYTNVNGAKFLAFKHVLADLNDGTNGQGNFVTVQDLVKADAIRIVTIRDEKESDVSLGYTGCATSSDFTSLADSVYTIKNAAGAYLAVPIANCQNGSTQENNDATNDFVYAQWVSVEAASQDVNHMYSTIDGVKKYVAAAPKASTGEYTMIANSEGNRPVPFFFKENNHYNGQHYYAMMVADSAVYTLKFGGQNILNVDNISNDLINGLRNRGINPDDIVNEAILDSIDEAEGLKDYLKLAYTQLVEKLPWAPLCLKVGVADNSLNGALLYECGCEVSTSTFAFVPMDESLYRHFNNANLGEVEGTQSFKFVEKTRGEYLMDENNVNLQNKKWEADNNHTIDYLGIWTADKASLNGTALGLRLDTVWVNRGLGNIKPQYLISVDRHEVAGTDTIPCTESTPHHEYLMDENNINLQNKDWEKENSKTIDYLGIWTANKASLNGTALGLQLDTVWINRGLGNIKPQYLISVAHKDVVSSDTIPCTETTPHHARCNWKTAIRFLSSTE